MLISLAVSDILAHVQPGDTTIKGTVLAWSDVLDWKVDSDNFEGLALDILTNGFSPAAPLMLGSKGDTPTLIDGHHRLSIAMLLGLDEVPVYVMGLGTGGMLEATADFGPRPSTKARA